MARRPRSRAFGSSPQKHTKEATRDAARANSMAIESAREVDAGKCRTALTTLLGARGAAAAATAHIASGGSTPPGVPFHQNVERATNHFASRCLRGR